MESMNRPEDWRELSELASKEMDSNKLLDLVTKLNHALDEHQQWRYGKNKIKTTIPPNGTSTAAEHRY